MFFVKLGTIVASILVFIGALRAGIGFLVAYGSSTEQSTAIAQRYLATASTGEAIDRGLWMFLTGVVVGLLSTIAKAVSK